MTFGAHDILGLTAGTLVLTTFAMRSMLWLRLIAILSNIAFLAYGGLMGLVPIWLLHAILLPLNCWRFLELFRCWHQKRHS